MNRYEIVDSTEKLSEAFARVRAAQRAFAEYSQEQVDRLIDIYFENKCEAAVRTKIYAYIAMCGLLWSNWCEFKRNLGVEFGEYSLRQYNFAKAYYGYAMERIEAGS